MLSTEVQGQGCPFWCQSAQKEATWGAEHAKVTGNLAFSRSQRNLPGVPIPTISRGIHSLGPQVLCAGMEKTLFEARGC